MTCETLQIHTKEKVYVNHPELKPLFHVPSTRGSDSFIQIEPAKIISVRYKTLWNMSVGFQKFIQSKNSLSKGAEKSPWIHIVQQSIWCYKPEVEEVWHDAVNSEPSMLSYMFSCFDVHGLCILWINWIGMSLTLYVLFIYFAITEIAAHTVTPRLHVCFFGYESWTFMYYIISTNEIFTFSAAL